jgi:hypothetical protein
MTGVHQGKDCRDGDEGPVAPEGEDQSLLRRSPCSGAKRPALHGKERSLQTQRTPAGCDTEVRYMARTAVLGMKKRSLPREDSRPCSRGSLAPEQESRSLRARTPPLGRRTSGSPRSRGAIAGVAAARPSLDGGPPRRHGGAARPWPPRASLRRVPRAHQRRACSERSRPSGGRERRLPGAAAVLRCPRPYSEGGPNGFAASGYLLSSEGERTARGKAGKSSEGCGLSTCEESSSSLEKSPSGHRRVPLGSSTAVAEPIDLVVSVNQMRRR